MAFHKKSGLKIEDMVTSRWVYRKLRNFRAGIEAGKSCLKRAYGLARSTWRGLDHFKAYVWSSVAAYNFALFTRLRTACTCFCFIGFASRSVVLLSAFMFRPSAGCLPTMPSADFWPFLPMPFNTGSTMANVQISRVLRTCLHAYVRRIYVGAFRTSFGL